MKIANCKLITILLALLFLPSAAWALEVFPSINGVSVTESMGPADWIKYIFLVAQALVGLAIIYAFVRAGILWMTGGDNPERIKEAKERIYGALMGLVILLGSYIFLNTINPQLVDIKNPSIQFTSDSPSGMLDFWAKLFITKHGVGERCGSSFDCNTSSGLVCEKIKDNDSYGTCVDVGLVNSSTNDQGNCGNGKTCPATDDPPFRCLDNVTGDVITNPADTTVPATGICTKKRTWGDVCSPTGAYDTACFKGTCTDNTCVKNQ